MVYRGHVKNGLVVPDQPHGLPEGMEVEFHPVGAEINFAQSALRWNELRAKLVSFGTLQVGWNGYKAAPPSSTALDGARSFIDELEKRDRELFPVRIAPSAVGGVGITFRNAEREGYVEFYNSGKAGVLLSAPPDEMTTRAFAQSASEFAAVADQIEEYLNG